MTVWIIYNYVSTHRLEHGNFFDHYSMPVSTLTTTFLEGNLIFPCIFISSHLRIMPVQKEKKNNSINIQQLDLWRTLRMNGWICLTIKYWLLSHNNKNQVCFVAVYHAHMIMWGIVQSWLRGRGRSPSRIFSRTRILLL